MKNAHFGALAFVQSDKQGLKNHARLLGLFLEQMVKWQEVF